MEGTSKREYIEYYFDEREPKKNRLKLEIKYLGSTGQNDRDFKEDMKQN